MRSTGLPELILSEGTYKNALIAKLSMKVSEYYKAALTSANAPELPTAIYFPPVSHITPSREANIQLWIAHITVKQMHFEAAAQYRMSQDALHRSKYGEEIARLRVAEGLAKKGVDASRRGVAEAVVSDLKVRRRRTLR